MRGLPIPDREEDFTADPAELFFDLVFVYAFSQLVAYLVEHPTWDGVGEFTLLFSMLWLPWSQFTWSANAVAGNSRPVRLLLLVATVASVPMAGSVHAALGDGGLAFALSGSVIMAMGLFTMYVGVSSDPVVRASLVRYSLANWAAIAVFIAGGVLDGGLRVTLWVLGLLIVVAGMVRAGSSEWVVRSGHFAERHGLIVIVALGEVIVALGLPVVQAATDEVGDAGLSLATLAALVAAGLFASLLWWSYFDRVLPALEHKHEELVGGHERGRFARDVYTWAHYPLVIGLLMATAGLEAITLHPSDPLSGPSRLLLVSGLSLSLLAVVVVVIRAYQVWAVERLVAVVALAIVVGLSAGVDGLIVLALVDLVLLITLVVEHLRVERWARLLPVKPARRTAG